jgi:hypothetical protein
MYSSLFWRFLEQWLKSIPQGNHPEETSIKIRVGGETKRLRRLFVTVQTPTEVFVTIWDDLKPGVQLDEESKAIESALERRIQLCKKRAMAGGY